MSIKWISAELTNQGRVLKADEGVKGIFNKIGKERCNLISIFGRARQGKSFLMNCLSGERDIFRVSNEKESCTQGIDIADKWLDLDSFSAVDGGKSVSGSMKIGFVDAEGQGDRNVTYDAALVCPILMISKCVIFNWKGDLQKDHILETLGIMTRAAKNIANSEEDAGASQGQGRQTKFSHLHIVFRDWQSVASECEDVYDVLFTCEHTAEGANRDRIRAEVMQSFASVKVWLLEAPVDTIAGLKSRLTIDVTTHSFRQQIRELRSVLSQQLKEPTVMCNRVITGITVAPLVEQYIATLNEGKVILPQSAFINMIRVQCDVLRANLQRDFHRELEVIQQLLASEVTNTNTIEPLSAASQQFSTVVNSLFSAYRDQIVSLIGDGHADLVQDYCASGDSFRSTILTQLPTVYLAIFNKWLRNTRHSIQKQLDMDLYNLCKGERRFSNESELRAACTELFESLTAPIRAHLTECNEEVTDALQQIQSSFQYSLEVLLKEAASKFQSSKEDAAPLIEKALKAIFDAIPGVMKELLLKYPEGFEKKVLTEECNRNFSRELDGIVKSTAFTLKEVEPALTSGCTERASEIGMAYDELRKSEIHKKILEASRGFETWVNSVINEMNVEEMDEEMLIQTVDGEFKKVVDSTTRRCSNWSLKLNDISELIEQPLQQVAQALQAKARSSYKANLEDFEYSYTFKPPAPSTRATLSVEEQIALANQFMAKSGIVTVKKAASKSTATKAKSKAARGVSAHDQTVSAQSWAAVNGLVIDGELIATTSATTSQPPSAPPMATAASTAAAVDVVAATKLAAAAQMKARRDAALAKYK